MHAVVKGDDKWAIVISPVSCCSTIFMVTQQLTLHNCIPIPEIVADDLSVKFDWTEWFILQQLLRLCLLMSLSWSAWELFFIASQTPLPLIWFRLLCLLNYFLFYFWSDHEQFLILLWHVLLQILLNHQSLTVIYLHHQFLSSLFEFDCSALASQYIQTLLHIECLPNCI